MTAQTVTTSSADLSLSPVPQSVATLEARARSKMHVSRQFLATLANLRLPTTGLIELPEKPTAPQGQPAIPAQK
jgi:hypothetical protein